MTSLLSAPVRSTGSADSVTEAARRRPLLLVGLLGGALAAGGLVVLCLGVAVTGWFLSDAASHGAPRDALRIGALGWLTGHGTGVKVDGVAVTAMPLLVTLLAAWSCWRVGLRAGHSVSGHGPDADQIADGERDWTVPVAAGCFVLGYLAVVLLTLRLAATPSTSPAVAPAVGWSLLLAGVVGGSAIAVGSGRAAIWTAMLPGNLRATLACTRLVVRAVLLVSFVTLLIAWLLDAATAINVLAQLQLSQGESALYAALTLLVLPNATMFSAAYLLGPGFTVGTGTLVSPTLVVTGPLPAFPLLAALPDGGPVGAWTPALIALPALTAAVAAVLAQRRRPTVRWEEGALRGCAGGVLAGVVLGLFASIAGGAVGPGRMSDVAPLAFDVLVHAITALGIGGLVGGLAATWWQRRTFDRAS